MKLMMEKHSLQVSDAIREDKDHTEDLLIKVIEVVTIRDSGQTQEQMKTEAEPQLEETHLEKEEVLVVKIQEMNMATY